jgi:peptidoglycan/LPS O-acetylase OafA/YrhL
MRLPLYKRTGDASGQRQRDNSAERTCKQTAPSKPAFYRPELDILRFFAFLGVFTVHVVDYPISFLLQHHIPLWAATVGVAVAHGGSYGVDVFFVLSAYLITELLLREKALTGALNVPAFYLRRALRIWPVYYLLVLLASGVPALNQHFDSRYALLFLVFMGNWSFVWFGWPSTVAGPLWSVSIEEQFYLLWPPIVARLTPRQIGIAAIAMVSVANIARLGAALLHQDTEHLWGNTFAHLDSIAAGIGVAVWLRGRALQIGMARRATLIVLGLVCFALRGHFVIIEPGERLGLLGTLIGYPAVVAASASILLAFIGLPWRSRALEYLGKISYGLYAYHALCLFIMDRLWADRLWAGNPGVVHVIMRAVLTFAMTVAFAALSYRWLERPFLELKRRFTFVSSRPV